VARAELLLKIRLIFFFILFPEKTDFSAAFVVLLSPRQLPVLINLINSSAELQAQKLHSSVYFSSGPLCRVFPGRDRDKSFAAEWG
jgi:hypothetical protein